MIEAKVGVETHRGQGNGPVFGEQGIGEREHRIDGVTGRAPVTVLKSEGHLCGSGRRIRCGGGLEEGAEMGKVGLCRHAFNSEKGFKRFHGLGLLCETF